MLKKSYPLRTYVSFGGGGSGETRRPIEIYGEGRQHSRAQSVGVKTEQFYLGVLYGRPQRISEVIHLSLELEELFLPWKSCC